MKKILSLFLVLLMVFTSVPIAFAANDNTTPTNESDYSIEGTNSIDETLSSTFSAGENTVNNEYYINKVTTSSSQKLVIETGDKMTRAEWLHNLALVFEMTVEDDIYPDNYFSDLDSTHEYYYDVLLNVNFGVIDVEAGGEVNPDGLLTRSFATHTLNFCLGYQLEDEDTYSFTDYTYCEYPSDAQVAVNRGWLKLVDGEFCPENSVTDKEVETMLDDAKTVLDNSEIDVNYDSNFTFSSDVIEVEDGTEIVIEDNLITIYDSPVEIIKNNIFAVYKSGIPLVYKAENVAVQENATVITATYIDDTNGNYIIEADAQGEANLEDVVITPAEGVDIDLNYEEEQISFFALNRSKGNKKLSNISAKGSLDLGFLGSSLSYSVKLNNPTIQYAYNIGKRTAQVSFESDVEVSTSLNVDFMANCEKEVRIFNVGVPGVGGLDVYLKFSLSGSVSMVTKSSCKVGASYNPKDNFRTIKNFSSPNFFFQSNASCSAGVIVKLGVTQLPLVKAYAYAETGGKALLDMKAYSSGTPKKCVEFAAYVYANYGVTFSLKLGTFSFESGTQEQVWSAVTSPAKIVKHYEDNKLVAKCTVGGLDIFRDYYTKYDSAYWGGWSDGDNTYGFSSTGKPIQIFEYSLDSDENAIITSYKGNATVVSIPETIDGYKVVGIGNSAFASKRIKSVTIPDTVTSIGYRAFADCKNLTSVKLSKNLVKIEGQAFRNIAITEIDIPDSVTEISDGAFADCELLTSVNLSKSLETMGVYAFACCESLTSIEIPKSLKATTNAWYGEYLYGYQYGPFFGCDNLKAVIFETGITLIPQGLFANNEGLEEIIIPDTVTSIGNSAFKNCINLKSVKLSKNLVKIESQAFRNIAITEIDIPDSVTEIYDRAFADCELLASVSLSKSLESMGAYTFACCESLTSIEIPKSLKATTDAWCGEYISGYQYGPFFGCDNLKAVIFETGITLIPQGLFANNEGLEEIIIPDTVTKIDYRAFFRCKNLKKVVLGAGVEEIVAEAFKETSLQNINLPETLKYIRRAAFYETNIETLDIPNSVTEMENEVFRNCTSLKTITLPNTLKNIGQYMFENCASLERIYLPSTVTAIQNHAFKDCSALKEVVFNGEITKIDSYAFENCDSLVEISIPDSVTSYGEGVFYDCDALTNITLGNGMTSLPKRFFEHCDALKKVFLPYRTTSIGDSAFKDSVSFNAITIPRTTTTIASNAFSYPTKLTIYGVAGTYAETYAKEIGATFVDKQVEATKVTFDKATVKLNKGQSTKLTMTVTPVDFTDEVTWKSSNTNVATISDDGTITAKSVGDAIIKINVGNVSASCKVTVVQPVTNININKSNLTMQAYETYQLSLSIYPNNAEDKTVEWSSSASDIASVDQNGLVTAYKKGEAIICVDAKDGSNKYATCKIVVSNSGVIAKSISELESPHNYPVNCTDFWQYTINGAESISVTFDSNTNIEDGFDFLYIYDKDNNKVGTYTGTELSGKTIIIPGDTFRIQFDSDSSGTEWGFKVTEVRSTSAHEHSYTSKITKQPTHTEEGERTYTCACGDAYTEPIAKTKGHTYTSTTVPATCTTDGKITYTCVCGDTYTETISAHHTDENKDNICDSCGAKLKDTTGEHEHSYTSTTVPATCTTDGKITYTCACGDSYTETIAAHHTDENGDDVCDVCRASLEPSIKLGETKTIDISAGETVYLAFTPKKSGTYKFTSNSTYDSFGYLFDADLEKITSNDDGPDGKNFEIICDLEAGVKYYFGARFYATSRAGSMDVTLTCVHKWDEGKVTTKATHTQEGVKTFTCAACGNAYTESIAKLPEHTYTLSKTVAPTCTVAGSKTFTCTCGDSYSEAIPVISHIDSNSDSYCDSCGTDLNPQAHCSCNCHKSGIAHFFFVIVNFFQKLFGNNKVCACGAAH